MANILDKKVTGSLFMELTWKEFADKIPSYFFDRYVQPLVFIPNAAMKLRKGETVTLSQALQELRFGKGDPFWKYPNNLHELKENYNTMEGVFFIQVGDKGRKFRTKLPKEVMDIVISAI